MNSVVPGLRGTSGKSVQVFQMQFVGLLLVLLVILGAKLNQPAAEKVKTIPRQFLVESTVSFSEIELGEVIQGVVVFNPQKLETLAYLLQHHDLKASVNLGIQASFPETLSVSDKILKALSQSGIASPSVSVGIQRNKTGSGISVSLKKLESREGVL